MDGAASSSEVLSSPESCSLPRRLGVKMGTRAFNGSSHPSSYQHKQFHSLDATQIGISPTFSDQMNRLEFSPERLVHSDIELASNMSDSDDPTGGSKARGCVVNRMNILPQRNYKNEATRSSTSTNAAYVIDSPQINNNTFGYHPQNDETLLNCSLQERLNSMGCVQSERCFRTVNLLRDGNGALGMQVAEGSDGNVYVKSITPSGPASQLKQIFPGDQIISVNGQTLLNLSYNKALSLLQNAPQQVEIILLQAAPSNDISRRNITLNSNRDILRKHSLSGDMSNNIVARLLNGSSFSKLSLYNSGVEHDSPENNQSTRSDIRYQQQKDEAQNLDNDLLNVEALKTINVLLALTKHNIERKSSFNVSTNSLGLVQKQSNEVNLDQTDAIQYSSSTESTPSKRPLRNKTHSFSMTQENKNYKRRPLSVHIPANVDIFGDLDSSDNTLEDENLSCRTMSCDNITVLKAYNGNASDSNPGLLKLTPIKKVSAISNDNFDRLQLGIPRNSHFGRKWAGHVKYPVTPSKVVLNQPSKRHGEESGNSTHNFLNQSDDEQIFI